MVGNEYIKHGYRINYNSTGKAILSVFQVHNETSNIWSHCLAALLSLWFVCYMTKFIAPPALSVEFGTNCTASEITFQKLHPDGSLIHSYYNHHIEEI
jgi:predicted membrane channel-forming protein YqfA (hemolysin III family)